MSGPTDSASSGGPRWARLRPGDHGRYPLVYHRTGSRVLERHPDPRVSTMPGYIWLEMPGRVHSVWSLHFDIVERDNP
jgi:hypothetical protein